MRQGMKCCTRPGLPRPRVLPSVCCCRRLDTKYVHTRRKGRCVNIYRVSQEEGTKLRESVPYVKIYRYNPKLLYPKLNGYGDNGQRKVCSSGGSTHCTLSANSVPPLPCQITEIPLTLFRQYYSMAYYACHV